MPIAIAGVSLGVLQSTLFSGARYAGLREEDVNILRVLKAQ